MSGLETVLASVGFGLLVLLVALALRRPVQRRVYADTGLEEWRELASDLPWRDRRAIYRSNARGRAAPPRLASLALRRGEVMTAVIERSADRSTGLRKLVLVGGVLLAASVVLDVVALFTDEHTGHDWLSLGGALVSLTCIACSGPLLRRQGRLTQRSVELNRAQLAG